MSVALSLGPLSRGTMKITRSRGPFHLVVKDQLHHLVTLKCKSSGTYATINKDKNVAEGEKCEQKLQLLDLGNGQFVIHHHNENVSWILPQDEDWIQITAGPIPDKATNPEGYKQACWTFEPVATCL
ncbi:hypothetical protein AZE42_07847 [Rhizopogon vesiculosus]|uniref:Ricin B lectin domain-containing protein n=1 Tax=Rhizopogon vesiculosus TaxID=180088 RepID=A0A1J8PYI3_9AGAM|nr:hypothetical protein AZE42_07847 [Rhizopogon vesiculosus]